MSDYVSTYIIGALVVFAVWLMLVDLVDRINSHYWLRRKWREKFMHRKNGRFWVSKTPEEPTKQERIKENA